MFFVTVHMLTPYAWHSSIPMLSSSRGGGEGAVVSLCELCIAVLCVRSSTFSYNTNGGVVSLSFATPPLQCVVCDPV